MVVPYTQFENCSKHFYCHQCLKIFITDQKGSEQKCIFGCDKNWILGTNISASDARAYLSDDLFIKFVNFNPKLFFCKTPSCYKERKVLDTYYGNTNREVKCDTCEKVYCSKCRNPWHYRLVCDQLFEDKFKGANSDEMESTWCGRCGLQVSKSKECPIVKCPNCKNSWCWTCGLGRNHIYHRY